MIPTKAKIAALLAALIAGDGAHAAGVPLRSGIFQGVAITTASQQIVGPSSALPQPVTGLTAFLYLENASSGAVICISFGSPATISGTTCTAGEITLTAQGDFRLFDTVVPTGPVYAVGSAAAGLTVAAQ